MAIRQKIAAQIGKELDAKEKERLALDAALRAPQIREQKNKITLAALIADGEEEGSQQSGGAAGGTSFAGGGLRAAPVNAETGPAQQSRDGLNALFGTEVETGSSDQVGPTDKSGERTRTTTTNFQRQLQPFGRLTDVVRLFNPDFATVDRQSTSRATERDPQHIARMDRRATQLAQSFADNGAPDKELLQQVSRNFNPGDTALILRDAKAQTADIIRKDEAAKFDQGKRLTLAAIQNGWEMNSQNTQVLFDFANGETPQEVGAAAEKMFKIQENTPEAKTARLRQHTAFLQNQEAKANERERLAAAEVQGLLGGASLRATMTADQIFDNWKGIAVEKGAANLSSSARGLALQLQLEEIARDGNVTFIKDKWINADEIRSHRNVDIINDFMIFEGRGFRKDGRIALSDDQIDPGVTAEKRRGAAKRLGGLGVQTKVFEDGSLGIGFQEESDNIEVLSRLYQVAQLTRAKELESDPPITIPNPYKWEPIQGVGTAPEALFQIGEKGEPTPPPSTPTRSRARKVGAFTRGGLSTVLENARTAVTELGRPLGLVGEAGGGFAEGLLREEEE
jgi:hypothetical protein